MEISPDYIHQYLKVLLHWAISPQLAMPLNCRLLGRLLSVTRSAKQNCCNLQWHCQVYYTSTAAFLVQFVLARFTNTCAYTSGLSKVAAKWRSHWARSKKKEELTLEAFKIHLCDSIKLYWIQLRQNEKILGRRRWFYKGNPKLLNSTCLVTNSKKVAHSLWTSWTQLVYKQL